MRNQEKSSRQDGRLLKLALRLSFDMFLAIDFGRNSSVILVGIDTRHLGRIQIHTISTHNGRSANWPRSFRPRGKKGNVPHRTAVRRRLLAEGQGLAKARFMVGVSLCANEGFASIALNHYCSVESLESIHWIKIDVTMQVARMVFSM